LSTQTSICYNEYTNLSKLSFSIYLKTDNSQTKREHYQRESNLRSQAYNFTKERIYKILSHDLKLRHSKANIEL